MCAVCVPCAPCAPWDPEVFGTAHFLSHLAFKRTHKRSSAKIIRDIESFGGDFSAGYGRELVRSPSPAAPPALRGCRPFPLRLSLWWEATVAVPGAHFDFIGFGSLQVTYKGSALRDSVKDVVSNLSECILEPVLKYWEVNEAKVWEGWVRWGGEVAGRTCAVVKGNG